MPTHHACTAFHFIINLPYSVAFPLFGAFEEQKWDPDWHPEFIHPDPPADIEGSVFRVLHADGRYAIWANTIFDASSGRVQYVNILGGAILTRIDITLSDNGAQSSAAVVYQRTALDPTALAEVETLATDDASKAPLWESAINAHARRISGPQV